MENQNQQPSAEQQPQQPSVSQSDKHTSVWLVIFLFLVFPPAALFLIFKEKYYHRWISILLWFYAIPLFLTYLGLRTSVIPQLETLYKNLNVPNSISTINLVIILFMIFLLAQIIFGIILFKKNKLSGYLSKKLLIIALLFFILDLFVSPGFIIIGIVKPIYNLTSSIGQPISPNITEQLSPTPTIDETANWKTYTSQNDGYTLKYPQDWNYKQNNPWQAGDIDFSNTKNDGQLFQISVNSDQVSLDTIAKDLGNKGNVSDIIIDGVAGKSVSFTMPSPPGNENRKFQLQQIEILKNNKHYILITERLEGSSDNTPNQILSTFKFTDQNQTPSIPSGTQTESLPVPAKWNKYLASCKSLREHVEIYYPDGWLSKEFENTGAVPDPNAQECLVSFGYPVQPQSYQAPTQGELGYFYIQTFLNNTESLDQRVKTISNQEPYPKSVSKITVNDVTWSKVEYEQYQTWLSTKIGNRFIELHLINATSLIGSNFDKLVLLKNYDVINDGIISKIKILP